jgi:hypothetical protein
MKLLELFLTPDQLKYKQLDKQNIASKQRELGWTDQSRQRIGGGAYADVYAAQKDPGAVDKIAKSSEIKYLADDPYYEFLHMLSQNDRIANNPFFPKVFKLDTFRDASGKYTYNVNMEKLRPLSSLRTDEIMTIGRDLFTEFDSEIRGQKKKLGIKGSKPTGDPEEEQSRERTQKIVALVAFADCFNEILMSTRPITTIKNPKLVQAMMFLQKILKSNPDFSADLHHANLMIRRGPYGVQVVITDPISGGGASPKWKD